MKAKKPPPKAPPKSPPKGKVERIVSIPDDLVLAPQAEAPRYPMASDRSDPKSSVRELSWAQFDRLVQVLARQIQRTYAADAVVGVAHGGVFVGGAVAGALGCDFFPVRISRRSRDKQPRSNVVIGEIPPALAGKKVLVVDDVSASGETLELARMLISRVKPVDIKTACLVQRAEGYSPDFIALPTDGFIVFPWDYEQVSEDSRFDVDPDKAGA